MVHQILVGDPGPCFGLHALYFKTLRELRDDVLA